MYRLFYDVIEYVNPTMSTFAKSEKAFMLTQEAKISSKGNIRPMIQDVTKALRRKRRKAATQMIDKIIALCEA